MPFEKHFSFRINFLEFSNFLFRKILQILSKTPHFININVRENDKSCIAGINIHYLLTRLLNRKQAKHLRFLFFFGQVTGNWKPDQFHFLFGSNLPCLCVCVCLFEGFSVTQNFFFISFCFCQCSCGSRGLPKRKC